MNDNNDEHTLVEHVQQDMGLPWQTSVVMEKQSVEEDTASKLGEEVPLGVESDMQHLDLERQTKSD